MSADDIKLYHATGSPNSRRVRIFLAEKALNLALVPVDLGQGEQHSDAYRAINPRRVVPTPRGRSTCPFPPPAAPCSAGTTTSRQDRARQHSGQIHL